MSTLPIYTGTGNETLRQVSTPVKKIDKSLLKLIRDMEETMHGANGIGLAAPQVGVHKRLILVAELDKRADRVTRVITMINPEILSYSTDEVVMEEGCLSLPDKYAKVRRPASVKVRYQDIHGREHTLHFEAMTARIIQHELDHLDGILFPDRIEGPLGNIADLDPGTLVV